MARFKSQPQQHVTSGRWFIRCRDGTRVYYYRAVLAAELGRLLRPDELAHHINGDPEDDRIENLEIITRAQHIRRHRPEEDQGRTSKRHTEAAPTASSGFSNGDLPGSLALYGNDGEVRAYALVDEADRELLMQWCWFHVARGYVARTVPGNNRARVYLHRQLLGLSRGDGLMGDHVNGDKLDNRRSNLRIVTAGGNAQNRRTRAGVTSRYRGVSWDAGVQKWMVRSGLNGRRYYLGLFDDEDEAGRVASAWRAENMPLSEEAIRRIV